MALTTPLPVVPGSRIYHGADSGEEEVFLIVPGTSDYVTGGYVITAAACRLQRIQSAWVVGANAVATGYSVQPVFALATLVGGSATSGYTQFLLKAFVITTGVEVANAFNLTGAIWQVAVRGY